jgi:hypothetical protein
MGLPLGARESTIDFSPDMEGGRHGYLSIHETKNSIIGLKVMPWDERYDGIWTSRRGHAFARITPPAD